MALDSIWPSAQWNPSTKTTSWDIVVLSHGNGFMLYLMSLNLIYQRTLSRGEKIQHDCLICFGSEQHSSFSCLIILGHSFQKNWTTARFDQAIKKLLNFTIGFEAGISCFFLIRQLRDMCDFGTWKSVSNQAAYYLEWMGLLAKTTWYDIKMISHCHRFLQFYLCMGEILPEYSMVVCVWLEIRSWNKRVSGHVGSARITILHK